MRELKSRGFDDLGDIFLFTAESPVSRVLDVFLRPMLVPHAQASDPVSLLDRPAGTAREEEVPIFVT